MDVEILDVRDKGVNEKERIVLKAISDCDLSFIMLFLTQKSEGETFQMDSDHIFWFPKKEVKKDDLIVLYTKKGSSYSRENKGGDSTHFYYLGLKESYYDSPVKVTVKIELDNWMTKF